MDATDREGMVYPPAVPPDRPIFIVAPPRSGTTLLFRCISSHPDVAYLNRADRLFPRSPRLARWVTRAGLVRDTPRESREFWFRFLRPRPVDVADEGDARPEVRAFYGERIAAHLAAAGVPRFAGKLPAHSLQIPFLLALFPDAIFVHPVRDWRATIASTMVKRGRDFKGIWFGVRAPGWREAMRLPPHLGAAWQYLAVHDAIEEQGRLRPGRIHRVRYEDLVADLPGTMGRVFEACGLRCDGAILARLPRDIRPEGDGWKKTLTPELVEEIRREYGEALERYG